MTILNRRSFAVALLKVACVASLPIPPLRRAAKHRLTEVKFESLSFVLHKHHDETDDQFRGRVLGAIEVSG